jgi:hypothetical protein
MLLGTGIKVVDLTLGGHIAISKPIDECSPGVAYMLIC